MRPLARWTFGASTDVGADILKHSVSRFGLLYPEFDRVICHNNLGVGQLELLRKLDVPLYQQSAIELDYPLTSIDDSSGAIGMAGWGWKLCPPRMRPDSYELWIDNDIIIRKRMPSLEPWLHSGISMISEGHRRAYGDFETLVSDENPLCAGFFGLPPGFDFASRILQECQFLNGKPLGHFNEQGLVAKILTSHNYILIPQSELKIVKTLQRPYPAGLHFIGVNRTQFHPAWEQYKCCLLI
jgi:hypothetical protein